MTELAVVDDHTFTIKTSERSRTWPARRCRVLGSAGALGVAIALDRLFHGADRGLWRPAPAAGPPGEPARDHDRPVGRRRRPHLHHQDQREGLELGRPVGAGVLGSAGALGVAIALDRLFHGADQGLPGGPRSHRRSRAGTTGTEPPIRTMTRTGRRRRPHLLHHQDQREGLELGRPVGAGGPRRCRCTGVAP